MHLRGAGFPCRHVSWFEAFMSVNGGSQSLLDDMCACGLILLQLRNAERAGILAYPMWKPYVQQLSDLDHL